jgi:polyhydroxyalkanoate synthesis regulator phasin
MEKMEDLFKKFVYTGVGMAALAKEKLEKVIEEFVEKNKMSTEEGEKIIKDFKESAGVKAKEMKETINKLIENAKTGFKFNDQNEIDELNKIIKDLEYLLEKKETKK